MVTLVNKIMQASGAQFCNTSSVQCTVFTYKDYTRFKINPSFQTPPISALVTQLRLHPPSLPPQTLPSTGWLPLRPLVYCIIIYFTVKNITFSHLGAHLHGPNCFPFLCPLFLIIVLPIVYCRVTPKTY